MKWPLRYGGVTYLGNVTDTVQTVQYSDSVHKNNIGTCVDFADGYMQGSIV